MFAEIKVNRKALIGFGNGGGKHGICGQIRAVLTGFDPDCTIEKTEGKRGRNVSRKRLFRAAAAILLTLCLAAGTGGVEPQQSMAVVAPPAQEPDRSVVSEEAVSSIPDAERITAEGTLMSTGDLLMHDPILEGAFHEETDTYDFSSIFTHIASYVKQADAAVANLEVALAGNEKYPYRGYPRFNCPDEIVDAAKDAGFSLLLTANNHTNDEGLYGIRRTMAALDERGMRFTGTRESEEEKRYDILPVGGIPVGILNYTYGSQREDGSPALNITLEEEAVPLVNFFQYNRLDAFYEEVEKQIAAMREDGARAVVFYIHWGTEYRLEPNKQQRAIAQKLCDLGVDVIIGGHPHVVQPIEILTSSATGKQTVCLYSMGNAVSNQRIYRSALKSGHTEDGVLFSVTFSAFGDGTVKLTAIDVLPTWVHWYKQEGKDVFQIIPLDAERDWTGQFDLDKTETGLQDARASYDRTMALVGEGLQAFGAAA